MKKEVIVHKNPKSPISEVFRTLRTNIQFTNINKKMKVILLTSTFPNEGKSWTASNLAVTFAQAGKKVVLIDADMRKGRQYAIFGISPKPGLSNLLSQAEIDENGKLSEDIGKYIQETEVENLFVITAGNIPPNPSELLVSAQMIRLIEELKNICDMVIIDGTPSELVTDSVILSRLADSTIIVTAHKITKKDALERVVKNINNVGGKIAGVVINKVPISNKQYGDRYYYGNEEKRLSRKNNNKDSSNDIKKTTSKVMNRINKPTPTDDIYIERKEEKEINKFNDLQFTPKEQYKQEHLEEGIFMEKTNDILKQINDYLDKENK